MGGGGRRKGGKGGGEEEAPLVCAGSQARAGAVQRGAHLVDDVRGALDRAGHVRRVGRPVPHPPPLLSACAARLCAGRAVGVQPDGALPGRLQRAQPSANPADSGLPSSSTTPFSLLLTPHHSIISLTTPSPTPSPQLARACEAVRTEPNSNCSFQIDALHLASDNLVDLLSALVQPLGGPTACGGEGQVASLFAAGIEQGVCEDVASGFVGTLSYQSVGGVVLFLLSLLLPSLWHSHQLPPLAFDSSLLSRMRRAALSTRSLRSWQRLAAHSGPLEAALTAELSSEEGQHSRAARSDEASRAPDFARLLDSNVLRVTSSILGGRGGRATLLFIRAESRTEPLKARKWDHLQ